MRSACVVLGVLGVLLGGSLNTPGSPAAWLHSKSRERVGAVSGHWVRSSRRAGSGVGVLGTRMWSAATIAEAVPCML